MKGGGFDGEDERKNSSVQRCSWVKKRRERKKRSPASKKRLGDGPIIVWWLKVAIGRLIYGEK